MHKSKTNIIEHNIWVKLVLKELFELIFQTLGRTCKGCKRGPGSPYTSQISYYFYYILDFDCKNLKRSPRKLMCYIIIQGWYFVVNIWWLHWFGPPTIKIMRLPLFRLTIFSLPPFFLSNFFFLYLLRVLSFSMCLFFWTPCWLIY